MIEGLAHIGVAVNDIDEAIQWFKEKFGAELDTSKKEDGKYDFGMHTSAVVKVGNVAFELMQAAQVGVGPVGKFIKERGEGLHHISLKVDKYAAAKADFEGKGMKVIGDMGVMAFLHPSTCKGMLTEFTEVA